MPTVAVQGQFRFVVNTRENSFEPPHVHVYGVVLGDLASIPEAQGLFHGSRRFRWAVGDL